MLIGNLEVYGIIYRIRNIINNKMYIGQTTDENGFKGRYYGKGSGVEKVYNYYISRKKNKCDYNKHLFSSISKYGLDSFEVDEIFDIAFSKEELDIKEDIWINYFNCINNGYNNQGGGSHGKHTNETIKKIIEANSIPVVQCTIKGEYINTYTSNSQAEKETGINVANISKCVNKIKNFNTAGGYIWIKQSEYEKMTEKEKQNIVNIGKGNKKEIIQLTKEYEVVAIYPSLSEAERITGWSNANISSVCTGKRNYHKKYRWMFLEDYNKLNYN